MGHGEADQIRALGAFGVVLGQRRAFADDTCAGTRAACDIDDDLAHTGVVKFVVRKAVTRACRAAAEWREFITDAAIPTIARVPGQREYPMRSASQRPAH